MRVLVVGAGPGGAAAAIELARGGADVRLVDSPSGLVFRSGWRPETWGTIVPRVEFDARLVASAVRAGAL